MLRRALSVFLVSVAGFAVAQESTLPMETAAILINKAPGWTVAYSINGQPQPRLGSGATRREVISGSVSTATISIKFDDGKGGAKAYSLSAGEYAFVVVGDRIDLQRIVPPAGTVRSATYSFDFRAKAQKTTAINQTFPIPAGATLVRKTVSVSSARGANPIWGEQANYVRVGGAVSGEKKPFGAGGVYQGTVTITYRYN